MSKTKGHGYGHTVGKNDHGARGNSAQKNNVANQGGSQSTVTTNVFFQKAAEGKTVKIGGAATPATIRGINKSNNTLVVMASESLKEFHQSSPKVALECGASTKCYQATTHADERKLTLTFGDSGQIQRKLR